MKERPIPFTTEMVKAILEGRKTMTRRVVKLPQASSLGVWEPVEIGGSGTYLDIAHTKPAPEQNCIGHTRTGKIVVCPYGQVGDGLWIRETFWQDERDKMICYEVDRTYKVHPDTNYLLQRKYNGTVNPDMLQLETNMFWHKKPSFFMPHWASRITLEITNIRVERLQEITDSDCVSEGITETDFCYEAEHYSIGGSPLQGGSVEKCAFIGLWDSINGKTHPWQSNPWVWVISFKEGNL